MAKTGKAAREAKSKGSALSPKGQSLSAAEIESLERAERPLSDALEAFTRGDYVGARRRLRERAQDESLPEAHRRRAADLATATRSERTALLVGLAAIGLWALIAIVTSATQP